MHENADVRVAGAVGCPLAPSIAFNDEFEPSATTRIAAEPAGDAWRREAPAHCSLSRIAQATLLELPHSPSLMVADAVPMHCATESSGSALLLLALAGVSRAVTRTPSCAGQQK